MSIDLFLGSSVKIKYHIKDWEWREWEEWSLFQLYYLRCGFALKSLILSKPLINSMQSLRDWHSLTFINRTKGKKTRVETRRRSMTSSHVPPLSKILFHWSGLGHLHPSAPTGVGPVPRIVTGRGSRHPLPACLKTLNSATVILGVQISSRKGSGAGSVYAGTGQGVAVAGSPVDSVAGQSRLFTPLASPPKTTVEMPLVFNSWLLIIGWVKASPIRVVSQWGGMAL